MPGALFRRHAREAMLLRGISEGSVHAILDAPAWTEPDPSRAGIMRAFGKAPETGDHWVRVVFRFDGNGDKIVITLHPDRRARPPAGVN